MTQIIHRFAEIGAAYDALFVDLWGCLHDGIVAFPAAVAAMQDFRAGGGKVVLVTNSPRPRASVEGQIAGFGIPADAYDAIATSGDSARAAMYRGAVGQRVWFMGEDRDQTFFYPLALDTDPLEITCVPLAEATGIVCCGPFDPLADPGVNRPQLLLAKQRGLKLLCANPDIVVDRGETREWCAGAIAALYDEMGGTSLYFGKPHAPIYDLARRRLMALPGVPADPAILCIGDGILTDIRGAMGEDLDALFITGGLAAAETGTDAAPDAAPDPQRLATYAEAHALTPRYAMGYLR